MTDRNAFSASQLYRRMLCPGSYLAERWLPDIPSPEAENGTRVHRAALLGDESGCTEDEIAVARRWRESDKLPDPYYWIGNEVTLWCPPEIGEPLGFSSETTPNGTLDRLLIFGGGSQSQIDDLKTGWSDPDDDALACQMGSYAGLVFANQPKVDTCRVRVYLLRTGEVRERLYDRDELPDILEMHRLIVRACELLDLNPSPAACRFCRACPTCPGPRSISYDLARADLTDLPGPQLGQLYEMAQVAARAAETVKGALRQALENGVEGTGYRLVEKPGAREVEDLPRLWRFLVAEIGEDAAVALVKISVPEAEKAFKAAIAATGSKDGAKLWRAVEKDWIRRGAPRRFIEPMKPEEA